MPRCVKCNNLLKSTSNTTATECAGTHPSVLELAYMVNLEYYIDPKYNCIHEVPSDKDAPISVEAMIDFLESRKWRVGSKTLYEGFKCTSFINTLSKQLVIVHRGTENWEQVKTDIGLALNIEENEKFVRNDFSLTLTGHSMGGWLAQMCTLLCKYPEFHPVGPRGTIWFGNGKSIDMNQSYDIRCVAFDSPGAGYILDRLDQTSQRNALLKGRASEVQNALERLDITVYLSNMNPVNMCGKHYGNVNRIDVMSEAKSDTWMARLWEKVYPLTSHKMANILKYFVNKDT